MRLNTSILFVALTSALIGCSSGGDPVIPGGDAAALVPSDAARETASDVGVVGHDAGTEGGPVCAGSAPEVCDGKDNDCDGVVDNGFSFQGMKVGTVCAPGVGACIHTGKVVCVDPSTAECSASAGSPDNDFHTSAAPNGSWDWNCSNGVDRKYPLADCSGFQASACPPLGWATKPGAAGDCGQDLIQHACSVLNSTCAATGSDTAVTEACR